MASLLGLGLALACGGGSPTPTPAPPAPIVASFQPSYGPVGASVIITGTHFTGAMAVKFGGTSALTPSVNSDTQITATVPAGATTGVISVTTTFGTASSASAFTIFSGTPVITGFNPKQGAVGTLVTIRGFNFTGATDLKFAGTLVSPLSVISDNQITAAVPIGAATGLLSISNVNGTNSSTAPFTVTTGANALDLILDGVYITQSVQTYAADVPLVANRDGHLRVFVLANKSNTAQPVVRVTLDGIPTDIPAPSGVTGATGVPTTIDEGDATRSWDMELPGSLVHDGMNLQVEIDPTHSVAEMDRSNNSLSTLVSAQATSVFRITIVPIIQSGQTVAGNVDAGRTLAEWVDRFQRMYPIQNMPGGIDVLKRSTSFTTSATLTSSDQTGWDTCLRELEQARVVDHSTRYYYGAVSVTYDSGFAGLGYTPGMSAIGWDKEVPITPGKHFLDGGHYPEIFAHEVGHNLNCAHAPCGVTGTTDSNWPSDATHTGALIGVWGWDHGYTAAFPDPTTPFRDPTQYKDIMSYCTPLWVSDYTYKNVLAYRTAHPDVVAPSPGAAAVLPQECLMIAGRVKGGQVILDPAFQVFTVPSPPQAGAYTLQLQDASGSSLAEISFGVTEVADLPDEPQQHFVFTIPMDGDLEKNLHGIRVLAQGQVRASRVTPSLAADMVGAVPTVRPPVAMRMGHGLSHVSWDHAVHPKIMVRDPRSGEVIAFAVGGSLDLLTDAPELEVTFSDGVRSQRQQLKVQE